MKRKIYLAVVVLLLAFSGAAGNISAQPDGGRICGKPDRPGEQVRSWTCGRVVDADGRPVSGIDVEISSAYYEKGSPFFQSVVTLTDKNGYFEGLPYQLDQGFYVISVNYIFDPKDDYPFPTVFYPNAKNKTDAKVFELNSGKGFEEILFRLPPRMVKKDINLQISWDDGTPAEQITAELENHDHKNYYRNTGWITDENGEVPMSVYADSGYQIKVSAARVVDGKDIEYYAETEIFRLADKTLDFKLILRPKINK